jgi:hypothetical protein
MLLSSVGQSLGSKVNISFAGSKVWNWTRWGVRKDRSTTVLPASDAREDPTQRRHELVRVYGFADERSTARAFRRTPMKGRRVGRHHHNVNVRCSRVLLEAARHLQSSITGIVLSR